MSSALAAAICRIFVGVVLLAAFIAQRRTRTSLRLQQINGYRIVPTRWQPLVLAILAATESLVGFLLLSLGRRRRPLHSCFSSLAP